jgi:hypothetical protein
MNADDLNENGEASRFCTCDELVVGEGRNRKRVPVMKYHDCDYVRQRNELLPQAIKRANEIVRSKLTPHDDAKSRSARFSRALSIEMDRLAVPLLRNGT